MDDGRSYGQKNGAAAEAAPHSFVSRYSVQGMPEGNAAAGSGN